MNREIKFRAWTGINLEYRVVAGQLGVFYVQGLDPEDTASMSKYNTLYPPEVPIMQYTGLKDKNRKEIYEGDIIRQKNRYIDIVEKVKWLPKSARWSIDDRYLNETEVIGNIWENPELLK